MSEKFIVAIENLEEEIAINLAKDLLKNGTDPHDILGYCRTAMGFVGSKFEIGEYFLPELILAGEILRTISNEVKPYLKHANVKNGPKILLGTVKGDIHDIGKDFVHFMLDVNGFQVIDLGVDVPMATFVEQIKIHQPKIVALSGFLTLAHTAMKDTVEAIFSAGFRDKVKIMIGGGAVDEKVLSFTGADDYGKDAVAAVSLAKKWTEDG